MAFMASIKGRLDALIINHETIAFWGVRQLPFFGGCVTVVNLFLPNVLRLLLTIGAGFTALLVYSVGYDALLPTSRKN